MNRIEFMAQLERLLVDIPESDKADAIAYYNDYFDEAGPENESRVIQELGSPGKVAATIKADMISQAQHGEYSETGYQDPRTKEPSQVPVRDPGNPQHRRGVGRWALLIILIIFASPFILGIGGGLIGLVAGVFGALIGLLAGGFGILIGGIAGIVTGVIECFTNPAAGMVMMGTGFMLLALTLIIISFLIWLIFKVCPKLFRGIVNWISRIVHRGKGGDTV